MNYETAFISIGHYDSYSVSPFLFFSGDTYMHVYVTRKMRSRGKEGGRGRESFTERQEEGSKRGTDRCRLKKKKTDKI